ncbi:hypothetical protein CGRA01v4_08993 [Colletotrichum graminicola]|nr:hypothetical protein CGRA01v4_08993 [Colletotrichum graminicola]
MPFASSYRPCKRTILKLQSKLHTHTSGNAALPICFCFPTICQLDSFSSYTPLGWTTRVRHASFSQASPRWRLVHQKKPPPGDPILLSFSSPAPRFPCSELLLLSFSLPYLTTVGS